MSEAHAILLASVLTIAASVFAFVRQKRYELVHSRYLIQGLDELCATSAALLNSHSHNFSKALEILRMYRDMPLRVDRSKIFSGWEVVRSRQFPFVAGTRVNVVFDSSLPWDAFQVIAARAAASYSLLAVEIPAAVDAHLSGDLGGSRKELVEMYVEEVRKDHARMQLAFEMFENLQALVRAVETAPMTTKALMKVRRKPVCLLALAKIEAALAVS